MSDAKGKRTYSEGSRAKMRESALARGSAGSEKRAEEVRQMMTTIQQEMAANQGVYPHNGGAVSLAEVARRCEIHPNTFHKKNYRQLKGDLDTWLKSLQQGAIVGKTRVRKELTSRANEWKNLYENLADSHRLSETDLDYTKQLLDDERKENKKLRKQLRILLNRLKEQPRSRRNTSQLFDTFTLAKRAKRHKPS
ncbi:hypothetical protein [Paraburkholderia sp. RL17-337-BIB-A]|uniref:hypothetical protein n=1 Tax=Paraburkholderia sp. RL17-337-BIB-A TaxID=3031636 RepID=UPI0038BAC2F7